MLLAVVLLGLAWRSARTSRPSVALLLGCVSVMLLAAAGNDLSRDSLTINLNPAVLNLIAGAVLVVVGVVWVARRRLSRQRTVKLTVGLVLAGQVSGRDFVSDPVQAVLGISGVGVAMFGPAWDLRTGSESANRDGLSVAGAEPVAAGVGQQHARIHRARLDLLGPAVRWAG